MAPFAKLSRFVALGGAAFALISPAASAPQFTPAEIAERPRWEEFLLTAKVKGAVQFDPEEAVTSPWKLTLEKDGVVRHALWKNVTGSPQGYVDNWLYEVAAYELDKLLGLGMVPPTVRKRFRGMLGSCQLWIEDTGVLMTKLQEGLSPKVLETAKWLRQAYIQQLFDNLIGNGDRHQGNILVSADERSFLIDHSRCFWLNFPRGLPFSGEGVMRELPRALVEKVRALDEAAIRQAVGKNLTGKEMRAVLARKGLVLAEVEKLIARHGEAAVLY